MKNLRLNNILPLFLILLSIQFKAFGQNMPGSDLFLVEIFDENGQMRFGHILNFTLRSGYDNQPSFTPDGGNVIYTSESDSNQTDIFIFNVALRQAAKLSENNRSEFSAEVMPDSGHFSTVVVEADSVQRLWKQPLRGGTPTLITNLVDSVAYYCWIDHQRIAIVRTTKPLSLVVVNIHTGKVTPIASNVGRCIKKVPEKDAFTFVDKSNEGGGMITEVAMKDFSQVRICETVKGAEDYIITKNGSFVMGQKSDFYVLVPSSGCNWYSIANFSKAGINNISRLAINSYENLMVFTGDDW